VSLDEGFVDSQMSFAQLITISHGPVADVIEPTAMVIITIDPTPSSFTGVPFPAGARSHPA
jgi:hypothetical protein